MNQPTERVREMILGKNTAKIIAAKRKAERKKIYFLQPLAPEIRGLDEAIIRLVKNNPKNLNELVLAVKDSKIATSNEIISLRIRRLIKEGKIKDVRALKKSNQFDSKPSIVKPSAKQKNKNPLDLPDDRLKRAQNSKFRPYSSKVLIDFIRQETMKPNPNKETIQEILDVMKLFLPPKTLMKALESAYPLTEKLGLK